MAGIQQSNYSTNTDELTVPLLGNARQNYATVVQPRTHSRQPSTSEFKTLIASLFAGIGSLCLGYCLGYSSPALQDLKTKGSTIHLNEEQGSFFASLVMLGAMIGCPLGGVLADYCGRKLTIIFSTIPFEAGWLMIRYASGPPVLDAGRLVTGIGCGIIAISYPVYVAEIASSKYRGALCAIHQLAITTGILMSYSIGVFYNWRDTAIDGIIMPIVLFITMLFMTETPRWFLAHNKRSAALEALRWLRGNHADIDSECFETERSIDMHTRMTCQELFSPSITRPLLIGVGLMVLQQMSGAIVIIMNCASIFASAGFTDAKLVSISVVGVQFIINIIACAIIDRVGRRTLLLSMAIVMFLSQIGVGTFFQLSKINNEGHNTTSYIHKGLNHSIPASDISWLAITSLVAFYIAFSISWGPVPWIVMSEVFPLRARGIAGSIATIAAFVTAFVLLWCYGQMKVTLTIAGLYWFYAAGCFLSFIFVYFIVPETRGQTLEEIETSFEPSRTYEVIN